MDSETIQKEGLLFIATTIISVGVTSAATDAKAGVAMLLIGAGILIVRGYMKAKNYPVDDNK